VRVVHKAFAVVIRARPGLDLLVFTHPNGTIQLPKGGVDPGEDPASAAVRELHEETGLRGAVVASLARHGAVVDDERQVWHSFVMTADVSAEAWDHAAEGSSDENGLVFACHFVPLSEARDRLHWHFHPVLDALAGSGWLSRQRWHARAGEWDAWVGRTGDRNRRLNSDPVLWRMLGDVAGHDVLDAGCGTGYLTAALADAGARVVGVDQADGMVAVARAHRPDLAIRVDDVQVLGTVGDAAVDLVVSNYVLMDLPDLDAAVAAMVRVLRPGGRAVVVFSHPCFTSGRRTDDVTLAFDESYFARGPREESWGGFAEPFLFWHRPLEDYLGAFIRARLVLEAFEEPIVSELAEVDAAELRRYRMWPYSIAVSLRRP
jgi:SAM-dependent methyltransferase